jgi:DNA-binding beta-propeller fold protein YncE
VRGGRELLVTTFDRDRKVGVLYRMVDGHAELIAGGTPERGQPRLLVQPEAAVADAAGRVFVADREQGVVIKLDARGDVLDGRLLAVTRPRLLALDGHGALWVGADGGASAPWQPGEGEIWKVEPDGSASLIVRGPVPAGMALTSAGRLFVADRHAGRIHVLTAEGRLAEFARFTDGDAPRGLAFAPVTSDTRRAGIAGDLFVVTIRRGAWPLNEVVRISGPFDEFEPATPRR